MTLLPFLHPKNSKTQPAPEPMADADAIQRLLDRHRFAIKLALNTCARCTLCADSCFLHSSHPNDPSYMPSHKLISSIGRLQQTKGRVSRAQLEEIADVVWGKCALCTRCYCPMRIDIPAMIALARDICRSQGIVPRYDLSEPTPGAPIEMPSAPAAPAVPARVAAASNQHRGR